MKKDNFSFLLVALLIFIIVVPASYDLGLMSLQLSRAFGIGCFFIIGIWSLRGTGWLFSAGIAAMITGIGLNVVSVMRDNEPMYVVSMLALLVFLALATYNALRQVAVGNEINPNRIIGAICIYLMLGVMWAIVYATLAFLRPDSFRGPMELVAPNLSPDWVYYSFVTITTLGYGDITPLSSTARALSVAEAVTGQFYIAVLVAGLVSAYISSKGNRND